MSLKFAADFADSSKRHSGVILAGSETVVIGLDRADILFVKQVGKFYFKVGLLQKPDIFYLISQHQVNCRIIINLFLVFNVSVALVDIFDAG